MPADAAELRVEPCAGGWALVGEGAGEVELVNDFLAYLADRNYSPRTVRAYAFDLLHFARWLSVEGLTLERVDTDALLRYLAACRTAVLPHQRGGNVYSIRDGRNVGYAPRTVNRRLAALSALFAFRGLRDPPAISPVPRGREARQTARGERSGLLGHLARPTARSRLRVREPRRLPRGLDNGEVAALLASFTSVRDRAIAGLMLFSGLRSCELLGLEVGDVDIPRGWVRVMGKGEKERRVPVDREVAALIQTYLLSERPEGTAGRCLWSPRGRRAGSR
jgi:site-specific recombinase XerD